MALQLSPLNSRPELFIVNVSGIYTTAEPRTMLSSFNTPLQRVASAPTEIAIRVNAPEAWNCAHYAGNGAVMNPMYFYAKKSGLFFNQNYLLISGDLTGFDMIVIRETESPNVNMFHRQPYYLLKSGVFTTTWSIKHFAHNEPPMSVDLSGMALEEALLMRKDDKLFILCQGLKKERIETENIVMIRHPELDSNCTAYADDWDGRIYVALSTKPELLIIDTETLAIQSVRLPEILDIRHAASGILIFASISPEDKELKVGQLEERYWMPKSLLIMQLNRTTRQLEESRIRERVAVETLIRRNQEAQTSNAKGNSKKHNDLLAAANQKISELTMENARTKRLCSQKGMAKIIEERDRLTKENKELEKKYRVMLLRFARQPGGLSQSPEFSDLLEATKNLSISSSGVNTAEERSEEAVEMKDNTKEGLNEHGKTMSASKRRTKKKKSPSDHEEILTIPRPKDAGTKTEGTEKEESLLDSKDAKKLGKKKR
ncbi:hypothetical protein PMAYCL1PPCAC_11523 [Pristionchus mayeri]|uniref:Uncharacterized protein n=1 Tax=Pristionchus mayeri TaxID=1317129 RepID=A0AAN5C8A3_9BILA|nr:hypothetical protein PMAYCL1PPCAC_11523 [Pristionchus mayeri]